MMRKWTVVGLALAAVLLSGAEGCQGADGASGKPTPYRTAGGPVRLPQPQPDHGAGGPKTPAPRNADPAPHDQHTYAIFVSWTPASEFVEIDWEPDGPFRPKQVSGGKFSRSGRVSGNVRVSVQAEWTSISRNNIMRRSSLGSITCVVVYDGHTTPGEGEDAATFPPLDSVYCQEGGR